MPTPPVIPCFHRSGQLAGTFVYGNNQYGPWAIDQKWTSEQWEGFDGPRVEAMQVLGALWQTMTLFEKNTWKSLADLKMLTRYAAFVMFNMPLLLTGRSAVKTPNS